MQERKNLVVSGTPRLCLPFKGSYSSTRTDKYVCIHAAAGAGDAN